MVVSLVASIIVEAGTCIIIIKEVAAANKLPFFIYFFNTNYLKYFLFICL